VKWLVLLLVFAVAPLLAQPQTEAPNAILLIAKPELPDPNFRETVVLVTQTADASTVGVILAERAPEAAAFHVLKDLYLTMHPANIEQLVAQHADNFRLYAGFSGWGPGQLEAEMARGGWYVLPANAELAFRKNTTGMWEELVRKARGRVALR
jgi:putative transcriptional regulator